MVRQARKAADNMEAAEARMFDNEEVFALETQEQHTGNTTRPVP